MDLANVVSVSLNQAQAAHNQLVRGANDGALEQMQTLRDFLDAELPVHELYGEKGKPDEVTSKETKAQGGQDEVQEAKVPPGGSHDTPAAETTETEKESPADKPDQAKS